MSSQSHRPSIVVLVTAVAALAIGFAAGQASSTGPDAVANTNATPCAATPVATPLATATLVPPAAMGEPVAYGDKWTVTVNGVAMRPTFDIFTATGIYAQVNLTIVNNTAGSMTFPYEDLVLRDAQGRVYLPDSHVKILNQAGWFSQFPPSLPTDGLVVFDVAPDATGPFVLESAVDPTFRISVEVEVRGQVLGGNT